MSVKELKTGIIGVGNMGNAHAHAIFSGKVAGMRLSALCDTNPSVMDALGKRFPVPVYGDYNEMLEKELLDAVIIATPHYSHCEIADRMLLSGLHTLVEKPISVRAGEAEQLAETAKKSGRIFAIMYNQRTNGLFRRTRELIRRGELGKIKKSIWVITNWYRTQAYYNSGTWRATWSGEGGGVLMNQAPHQLDLWQWMLGMPTAVTAFGSIAKYHHIEVEDDATIVTEYADGSIGIFTTSTGEYPGTNRLEISGTQGKLVLEDGKLKRWKLKKDEEEFRFTTKESFGQIPYEYSEIEQIEDGNGHLCILQNFTNAILLGEKLISPGAEGINEITLANAAYLSMWTGDRVTLPLCHEAYNRELDMRIKRSRGCREIKEEGSEPAGVYSERWQVRW